MKQKTLKDFVEEESALEIDMCEVPGKLLRLGLERAKPGEIYGLQVMKADHKHGSIEFRMVKIK